MLIGSIQTALLITSAQQKTVIHAETDRHAMLLVQTYGLLHTHQLEDVVRHIPGVPQSCRQ